MLLSIHDWHNRFSQQARWTRELRKYLFERAQITRAQRILEVGCGTGAIMHDLAPVFGDSFEIHGLDLKGEYLAFAKRHSTIAHLVIGDGLELPYSPQTFDLVYCHFLLLWVQNPIQIVREMRRVVRPGGSVLALAEPDYGGRIDYPEQLSDLGKYQMQALKNQGADPHSGRKVKAVFQQAGLEEVEAGVLGGQWKDAPAQADVDMEWRVLREDIKTLENQAALADIEQVERRAWQDGVRLLYVPTFYAWGKVKN